MAKMERHEALALGLKIYESKKICTAGHIPTMRYAAGGSCVSCLKARYQQSATAIVKATVPRHQLRSFHELCKAMGWRTNAAPSNERGRKDVDGVYRDANGLDTGYRD